MIVLSLCDLTGNAVRPWADAGYDCLCVDLQHGLYRQPEGRIRFIRADVLSWLPPRAEYAMCLAFPPCTDLAVSGAKHFQAKGLRARAEAIGTVAACLDICEWTGAPYCVENPVGILSTHWRKPDHLFHPWEYAGWLPDIQAENTSKKTCLWTGGGFVMPAKRPAPEPHHEDCWKAAPSPDRANDRSATPMGFARAVFETNHQQRKAA